MTHFLTLSNAVGLAHRYWSQLLKPGDTAIDATCGNGHDALFIAQRILSDTSGQLICCDMQPTALEASQRLCAEQLSKGQYDRIQWISGCHSEWPPELSRLQVRLVVYNLGYLPGGDKTITTRCNTTLDSIKSAMQFLAPGGMVSITCYPGHAEGRLEQEMLLKWVETLDKSQWCCVHHHWCNRTNAPSLLLLEKAN
jgi:hypothetical protein